ncbi:hypothetical protein LguiA_025785 [Lonicera macranthoides]
MLRELPELPSGLHRLFATDCASLRVSADRFAMCKIEYCWFQYCRKLLDYGESELVASTLLEETLRRHMWKYIGFAENFIFPGSVIPKWFCNHTFTGDSVLLKLPRTCRGRDVFPESYSFFVIWEVINEVKPFNFSENAHINVLHCTSFTLQCESWNTSVEVELMFAAPCDVHSHFRQRRLIALRNTGNLTGLEHTIMGCSVYSGIVYEIIKVGMRSLNPDTVVVKKWGMRIEFKNDYEEEVDY